MGGCNGFFAPTVVMKMMILQFTVLKWSEATNIVDDQMETQGNVEKEILKESYLFLQLKKLSKSLIKTIQSQKEIDEGLCTLPTKNIYIGQGQLR